MRTIHGEEHGLGGHFMGITRAYHYLAFADAAHQYHVPDRYPFLLGKALDAAGQNIPVLKAYDKYPPYLSFRCFHQEPPKYS
jgi:hypothetical protein